MVDHRNSLGAGFNPDFTGIENVYLNAALLGLSRAEVDARLDSILAFADIGAFVHQPVKTYSSGMFVRLAFAVATSLDPEILVIDEALSVGDGAFARKSFERVMQMREQGAAVLFCSHSMYHVHSLCSRALWLEGGRVRMYDTSPKVTSAYETALVAETVKRHDDALKAASNPYEESAEGVFDAEISGDSLAGHLADGADTPLAIDSGDVARLVSVEAWTDDGQSGAELAVQSCQTTVGLRVRFASNPMFPAPAVAFGLVHLSGVVLSSGLSSLNGLEFKRDARGNGEGQLTLPSLPLFQGSYFVRLFLTCERGLHIYEHVDNVVTLQVSQAGPEQGMMAVPHTWQA